MRKYFPMPVCEIDASLSFVVLFKFQIYFDIESYVELKRW